MLLYAVLSASVAFAEDEAPPVPQVQYFDIEPAFVANFGVSKSKLKFVKANVAVRATSDGAIDALVSHEPRVRHEIVMLLSRQNDESMVSSQGQEEIRAEALQLVQAVLEEETGSPQIDDLLFTTFVVQR